MPVEVGWKVPNVKVWTMAGGQVREVWTGELLAGRRAVLFGVPGAFTPTCSDQHLPGFVRRSGEIRAKGIDLVACTAVNDAFVLDAWAKAREAGDILMLADGNGELARALGLETDSRAFGLGMRSRRYAAVVEDGVVRWLGVDPPGSPVAASGAEAVLAAL